MENSKPVIKSENIEKAYSSDGTSGENTSDESEEVTIHSAARDGKVLAIHELSKQGVDINAKDYRGKTPLMIAAIKNRKKAVAALLVEGADRDLVDNEGNTALMLAFEYQRRGIANILMKPSQRIEESVNMRRLAEQMGLVGTSTSNLDIGVHTKSFQQPVRSRNNRALSNSTISSPGTKIVDDIDGVCSVYVGTSEDSGNDQFPRITNNKDGSTSLMKLSRKIKKSPLKADEKIYFHPGLVVSDDVNSDESQDRSEDRSKTEVKK